MLSQNLQVKAEVPKRVSASADASAFAQYLVDRDKLSESALERARLLAGESGEALEVVLPRLGLISEREIAEALAGFLDLPLVTERDFPKAPLLEEKLGSQFLKQYLSLPKTPSAELCGLKQNRTMVGADGGARKPSVGVCLEQLPIARASEG
jgi:hypothetical protein